MCRHTGTNVYAEFFFLTCPHTHRHADTHGQHSVPEQTAASTFSSVFLSPSLLVSSSHIRHSSSNPPSPNLAVILYYQTSAEAKLEAQLLQQKTLRALLCEELLWQQRERESAPSLKRRRRTKRKADDLSVETLPFCHSHQMPLHHPMHPAGLFSPVHTTTIFLVPFSPPHLYMTSAATYLPTGEGPPVFLYLSNLKWISPQEEKMNSAQVSRGQRD